jgi:hypothetical protein
VKLPRCPRVTVSIKSKLHTKGFYQWRHERLSNGKQQHCCTIWQLRIFGEDSARHLALRYAYWCWSRNPTKSATGEAKGSVKKTHFLSLYLKIFDYSLGGYYHQERWARIRRYYKKRRSYYLMIKGATIYLSLY